MPLTEDYFLPNSPSLGGIGNEENPWGEGHFTVLVVGGAAVAGLNSPAFTGTPTTPTAAPGTNTTQIASTAFATAAATAAKSRSNHSGTQLAATISDFATAVAATNAGTKAHTQGTDAGLDTGGANAVTAAALRAHLDDAAIHFIINDAAEAEDEGWSSSKIAAELAALAGAPLPEITPEDITGLGDLATLDTVGAAQIDPGAVTGAKLAGGTATPTGSFYYGTNAGAALGFHSLTQNILLKSVPTDGLGRLELEGGELVVSLGTTAKRAASGADARFPTAGEKAALAGNGGTPGSANKYVTEIGLLEGVWPAPDNVASFVNSADETKAIIFALAGISTGTTRTITFPDVNVNLGTDFLRADGAVAGTALQELLGINLTDATELTIASGSVTATQSLHAIDTEGDAVADDLATIVAAKGAGDLLLLYPANAARIPTLQHGVGNIETPSGVDFELTGLTLLARVGSTWKVSMASYDSGGTTLPVTDTTAIAKDPADSSKRVRLDAGAVATDRKSVV